MATILIEPVSTTSKGGFPVTVTGIAPTDHDCIIGEINTPSAGKRRQVWDKNGRARDNDESCNINMSDDELREIAALSDQLGPTDKA